MLEHPAVVNKFGAMGRERGERGERPRIGRKVEGGGEGRGGREEGRSEGEKGREERKKRRRGKGRGGEEGPEEIRRKRGKRSVREGKSGEVRTTLADTANFLMFMSTLHWAKAHR